MAIDPQHAFLVRLLEIGQVIDTEKGRPLFVDAIFTPQVERPVGRAFVQLARAVEVVAWGVGVVVKLFQVHRAVQVPRSMPVHGPLS